MISVILNIYKRPEYLNDQIYAVLNQSVKVYPKDIHIWINKSDKKFNFVGIDNFNVYNCNWNTKFWGRFMIPLLCNTKYVAIFDDDTIPQKDWFKNCIETIENPKYNGILGGSGVLLKGDAYDPHQKYGWIGINNEKPERVDLVGHAWFFRQEWAKYMWYEKPYSWENGEDITFSYLAKKYGDINTYVPPHPISEPNLWCTNSKSGSIKGNDESASWRIKSHKSIRNEICRYYIKKSGWKTVLKTK